MISYTYWYRANSALFMEATAARSINTQGRSTSFSSMGKRLLSTLLVNLLHDAHVIFSA